MPHESSNYANRSDDSLAREKKKVAIAGEVHEMLENVRQGAEAMDLDGATAGGGSHNVGDHLQVQPEEGNSEDWKQLTIHALTSKVKEVATRLHASPLSDLEACIKLTDLMAQLLNILQKLEGFPDQSN